MGGRTKTCSELPVSSFPVRLTGNLWRSFFQGLLRFPLVWFKITSTPNLLKVTKLVDNTGIIRAPKLLPLPQSSITRARFPQCKAPKNYLPLLPLCQRPDSVQNVVSSNTKTGRGGHGKGCQRQECKETKRGLCWAIGDGSTKPVFPIAPSSGKHQLMGIECSQSVCNIYLNSYDLHEKFLTAHHEKSVYWLRWICTGPAQYKHGEIQEITVLSTLPIYRAPSKFTTKQKQKRAQKPYLLHCFSSSCFISQWAL